MALLVSALKRFRLGAWADWKDEWFADVSKARLRRVLTGRIAPSLLAKGFDGLFLDNVDMVETANHADQRDGMRELVEVARDARPRRRAPAVRPERRRDPRPPRPRRRARRLEPRGRHLDLRLRPPPLRPPAAGRDPGGARGAERDGEPRPDHDVRGLHPRGDEDAQPEAVANACSAGALPYVGDIGLTARRLPDPPLTCP